MKEKDTLVPQTDEQRDTYRALPEQFEIVRDGDAVFHGQRSDEIQKASDSDCGRKFTGTAPRATSVDDAGAPHGDGMGSHEK